MPAEEPVKTDNGKDFLDKVTEIAEANNETEDTNEEPITQQAEADGESEGGTEGEIPVQTQEKGQAIPKGQEEAVNKIYTELLAQRKSEEEAYWKDQFQGRSKEEQEGRYKHQTEGLDSQREMAKKWFEFIESKTPEEFAQWVKDNPQRAKEAKERIGALYVSRLSYKNASRFNPEGQSTSPFGSVNGNLFYLGYDRDLLDHAKTLVEDQYTPFPDKLDQKYANLLDARVAELQSKPEESTNNEPPVEQDESKLRLNEKPIEPTYKTLTGLDGAPDEKVRFLGYEKGDPNYMQPAYVEAERDGKKEILKVSPMRLKNIPKEVIPEPAKETETAQQAEEKPEKLIDKSELKLKAISNKELVNSEDPMGNKTEHEAIKKDYKELLKIIECLG